MTKESRTYSTHAQLIMGRKLGLDRVFAPVD